VIPEDAAKLRAYVTAAWMRPEHMPPIEFWASLLSDIPIDAARETVDAMLALGEQWPPTPGQVRRRVFADNGLLPMPAALAWEKVIEVFSANGAGVASLDTITARALRAFAGTEYRSWQAWRGGQSSSVRKVFMETYAALTEEATRTQLARHFDEAMSEKLSRGFSDTHGLSASWEDNPDMGI